MSNILKAFSIMILFCVKGITIMGQYSFSGMISPSATIQTVVVLSITSNVSPSLSFTIPSQYSNGYTITNFNKVSIKSNMPWMLSVTSATPFFSFSGSNASSNMPASVISLAVSGQPSTVQLGTSSQQLASGSRGDDTRLGNSFSMNLTANPGYNYGPGIYSLSVNYTLTAQ